MNFDSYLPTDKSWAIRMGALDLLNGYRDTERILRSAGPLPDDLVALQRVVQAWPTDEPLDVGESGTLYRFLRFAAWKTKLPKRIIMRGTLKRRPVTDNPTIVHYPQRELLKLDGGTSQWASAAALAGDKERLPNPPYKLSLTYEAIDDWLYRRQSEQPWQLRTDPTIKRQVETFIQLMEGGLPVFEPRQAEDYPFARVFGFVTVDEGKRRWPSLAGHESNRFTKVESALGQFSRGSSVESRDHRVVQAVAMYAAVNGSGKPVKIDHPLVVSKSWPRFWDFMKSTILVRT